MIHPTQKSSLAHGVRYSALDQVPLPVTIISVLHRSSRTQLNSQLSFLPEIASLYSTVKLPSEARCWNQCTPPYGVCHRKLQSWGELTYEIKKLLKNWQQLRNRINKPFVIYFKHSLEYFDYLVIREDYLVYRKQACMKGILRYSSMYQGQKLVTGNYHAFCLESGLGGEQHIESIFN